MSSEWILHLRGGFPEKCDFCQQPYTQSRSPTPDEAGQWACSECWERWENENPQPLPAHPLNEGVDNATDK